MKYKEERVYRYKKQYIKQVVHEDRKIKIKKDITNGIKLKEVRLMKQ